MTAITHCHGVDCALPVVDPASTDCCRMYTNAIDCTIASGTVTIRVHCWILRRPDSPSLCSSSSFGIAFVSNCVIILAVINGLMPTSTIEIWLSAPPLIRFKKPPKSLLLTTPSMILFNSVGFASGTGTCAKNRNATIKPNTMPRRFCISRFLSERTTILQFILQPSISNK